MPLPPFRCVDRRQNPSGRRKKIYPRETYDEVLSRLLEMACDPEPLFKETLRRIEEDIADIRAGRCRPLEEIAEEPGLE
ncbi:MAG: hypothetical protein GX186_09000 [Methanoculleus thermophilus]|uniref:hypothetical protein n=1 Tax=Methanoculleus thermophilus TaxID=2200 RepID=UPI00082E6A87|nr:hypothetical protein [Methanoculleus thermophilus]